MKIMEKKLRQLQKEFLLTNVSDYNKLYLTTWQDKVAIF